jgi:hypothetical protein
MLSKLKAEQTMFQAWKIANNEFDQLWASHLREDRQKMYDMRQALVASMTDKFFVCGAFEKLDSAIRIPSLWSSHRTSRRVARGMILKRRSETISGIS